MKQYVVETLVCGNCLYASQQNKHKGATVYCCFHQKPVSVHSPFCMDFHADWVIDSNPQRTKMIDTGQEYVTI